MRVKKAKLVDRKLIPTEEQEQIAFFEWLQYQGLIKLFAFHIPNGGSRNVIEAKKLKRMGVRKGVSDVFIPYPKGKYHGLWIEFKSLACKNKIDGGLIAEQKEWLINMNLLGYATSIAYSCDEATKITNDYLNIN